MKYAFATGALLAFSLSSCGSISRGTSEMVMIQSDPPGATVTTDIGLSCPKTPCSLDVPRKKAFTATAHLNGKSGSVRIDTVATAGGNVAIAGNAIVGGIIGVGIDAANGANKDHKPNPAMIVLR